jgi:hypothetical protein
MVPQFLCRVLLSGLVSLAAVTAARGQTCSAPSMFPPAPAAFTHTAAATGSWNTPATWGGTLPSHLPGSGAIVCIPAGRVVTVTSQETSRLRFVQVNGELRMWIHGSTRLLVDTLYIDSGGQFKIGDPVNTVKPNVVAELIFIAWNNLPIDRTWDLEERSRGLISHGTVRVYGEPKTNMVPVAVDVLKNATGLTAAVAPTNWKANDNVVLTGSYFRRVGAGSLSSQDERRMLAAAPSGTSVSFTQALAYDHVRPRSDLRLHLANLTRNVRWSSESTSIPLRGHVMMMHGDVDLRHVALINLGRTNKAVPLNDMVVTLTTNSLGQPDYSIVPRTPNSSITNRRGSYALHFHLNGTFPGSAPPSKVYDSVVDGAVGWGFVSHSSHVDFQRNVAYDFTGAGFVTEFGDELGNFYDNIAIRGTGDGVYDNNRIVFNNSLRPQPLGDFAFRGDGFWFQGPALRARNNVAAGCDGVGMIWFTTGSPDVKNLFTENGLSHVRYSSFPRNAVNQVYSLAEFPDRGSFLPRYWDHSTTNEKLLISDLPILECDGFEGYGNLIGFRPRFNNNGNVDWYTDGVFDFEDHIVPVIGSNKESATRMRQRIKNIKVWNNEVGIRPNYTMRTDWSDVAVINRLDYNAASPYAGAIINFQIQQTTIKNITVDGYEVAGWIENDNTNVRNQITFSGSKNYLNYVNLDIWNTSLSCATPTDVSVSGSGTSRTISWAFNAAHQRYMVRYRINGEQQWKLATTTTTSVLIGGLSLGKTYTYQVVAGCKNTSTGKETAPSNYTTAAAFGT